MNKPVWNDGARRETTTKNDKVVTLLQSSTSCPLTLLMIMTSSRVMTRQSIQMIGLFTSEKSGGDADSSKMVERWRKKRKS